MQNFFTVVDRAGELYQTNYVTPAYSETDHSQQVAFVSGGKLYELPAADVLSIRINPVPFQPACSHCKN